MQPVAILFGAAFTCAACLALGKLLLRDACRDPGVRFVTGAAALSLVVCLLCGAGLVYRVVLLAVGLAAIAGAGKTPEKKNRGQEDPQGPGGPSALLVAADTGFQGYCGELRLGYTRSFIWPTPWLRRRVRTARPITWGW